jgi:diketogulonate reductase-like aldo/keto reductase
VRAFAALKQAGKIRAYGVSNFDAGELREAVRLAGPGQIACNQVLYHLRERAIEHQVIAECERHNVSVVAYSPFGSGDFPSPSSKGGKVLGEIARERGVSPFQVALRFLLRQPSVFTIPKASRPEHAEDNAAAGSWQLSAGEVERIDQAFPLGKKPRSLPTI